MQSARASSPPTHTTSHAHALLQLMTAFGEPNVETRFVSQLFYSSTELADCTILAPAQRIFGQDGPADPMETNVAALRRWRVATRELALAVGTEGRGEPWMLGWLTYGAVLCERARTHEPHAWESVCAVIVASPRFGSHADLPFSVSEARESMTDREIVRLEHQLASALMTPAGCLSFSLSGCSDR